MSLKMSRRSFLTTAAALAAAVGTRRVTADTPKPSGKTMSAGTTAFALDLYGQLAATKGNTFFSPFSVSAALAMTSVGAKGDTLAQMRQVLRLDDPSHAGFADLLKQIRGEPGAKRGFELSTANAIWAQTGYPWRDEFVATVREQYQAGLKETNFAADPEAARLAINAWVEEQTRERIKDLFVPGTIDAMTRMVLANAVYFKGTWRNQFDKQATRDAPFLLADGSKATVPLMYQSNRYALAEADDRQTIELPYAGNDVSMVVILPRKPDGLAAIEQKLTPEQLALPAEARPTEVQVFLPRFKVETRYELNKTLQALGMTDAFNPQKADFTGMVTQLPERDLYISDVIHKAFVDVNEEGTEAAAATGIVIRVTSAAPSEPKVFRADRPFLFVLRHVPTGTVLFLGRYEKPA